jgi:hypothetical protein
MTGPNTRADWRRVENLYRQFNAIVDDKERTNVPPDQLTGSLAESLGRVLAHYDGSEINFVEDFLSICSRIQELKGSRAERFRSLYHDERLMRFAAYNPPGDERRRPRPFEAAVETCRRLRDLNGIRDGLASVPTAAILGGSSSYGRFFNTLGSDKPSDTDLLLVVPNYDFLSTVVQTLSSVEGVEKGSLEELEGRISLFSALRQSRSVPYILSHKVQLWDPKHDPFLRDFQIPSHYLLSVHFFSLEDFKYLILQDRPVIDCDSGANWSRYLLDYRNTDTMRADNQRCFNGTDTTLKLEKEPVDGGVITTIAVCNIIENRFSPGLHQNLILPQFEIRWDSLPKKLYLPVMGFRWKILERLTEERRLYPFEFQTLSLSHTRSAHFAPHIRRRADRE